MKKIFNHTIFAFLNLCIFTSFIVSCSDFTEIQPKGKNLLASDAEIDMLLNYDYSPYQHFGFQASNTLNVICNDIYPITYLEDLINSPVPSLNKAYFTYDESIDRVSLSHSDETYNDFYDIIGKMANPVLAQVDAASGDATTLKQYKAEALVMRAYAHYILANLYAKAYTSSNGSEKCIPYMTEDMDASATVHQNTIQEVYDHILADVNAALALNSLPYKNENTTRVSKTFALTFKAQVLMSLGKYDEALAAAQESDGNSNDEFENSIEDYNVYVGGSWTHSKTGNDQDLFFIANPLMETVSTVEMTSLFEDGDIMNENHVTDMEAYGMELAPLELGIECGPCWFDMDSYYNYFGMTASDTKFIKAECYIRKGDYAKAADCINAVRVKRIEADKYEPLTIDADNAIPTLQRTYRVEHWMTAWNFITMKRWNTESKYQQTLTRDLSPYGLDYSFTIKPDSKLWILPFSMDAVANKSDIQQNF